MRELYEGRKITVIFQPHLYTRTRDFHAQFADSLSLADEVILTDIYPAREEPIPGVTSQLILDGLHEGVAKRLCRKEDLPALLRQDPGLEVVIVLGAGDIDSLAPAIARMLSERLNAEKP